MGIGNSYLGILSGLSKLDEYLGLLRYIKDINQILSTFLIFSFLFVLIIITIVNLIR